MTNPIYLQGAQVPKNGINDEFDSTTTGIND
jgi:hypothetical protein